MLSGVANAQPIDAATRDGVNDLCGPVEWGWQLGPLRVVAVLDAIANAMYDPRCRVAENMRFAAADGDWAASVTVLQ